MRSSSVAIFALAACTYQPQELKLVPCAQGCTGECVDGVCVVPVGAECEDDVACAGVGCICTDATCSSRVCADVDCGECGHSVDGLACAPQPLDDGVACTLDDRCTLEAECQSGECVRTRRHTCKDDDPCTSEDCVDGEGCTYAAVTCAAVRYFSYHRAWATFVRGIAIPPMVPILDADGAVTFTVTPPLPAGLSLDATTGIVSGTPTDSPYAITHTFQAGGLQTDVTIRVYGGFVVNDANDQSDASPGDTLCAIPGGGCTLRAAVEEANALGGPHAILLEVAEVGLANGPISTGSNIAIYAADADDARINAQFESRHFEVDGGTLWLSDLWLKHGRATGAGAVHVAPGQVLYVQRTDLQDNHNITSGADDPANQQGGAIHVEPGGFVDIAFCTAYQNANGTALGDGPGVLSLQDAIGQVRNSTFHENTGKHGGVLQARSNSTVTVNSCFFDNNRTDVGDGGAIDAGDGGCRLYLINNTFVENHAERFGGVLWSGCTYTATLLHNTMVGNTTTGGGSAQGGTGAREIFNSISANPGEECQGTAVITGFGNMLDDASCNLDLAENHLVTQPQLEDAADNRGPTWTVRPLPDSRAVDGGEDSECIPFDQRGLPRSGLGCDIGAVELQ